MITKKCTKCGSTKLLNNFNNNKNRPDGHVSQCKTCTRVAVRQHYEDNKDYYVNKAALHAIKKFKWLIDYKVSRGCQHCPRNYPERQPEKHPGCLSFHHRDPKEKVFTIGAEWKNRPFQQLKVEVAKCDVICLNCHGRLHWDETVHRDCKNRKARRV